MEEIVHAAAGLRAVFGARWGLGAPAFAAPLLAGSGPLLLCPDIAGATVNQAAASREQLATAPLTLRITAPIVGGGRVRNDIRCLGDRLIVTAAYDYAPAHRLRRWVLADGGHSAAEAVQAYRGMHQQRGDGQVHPLHGEWRVSTASHNWTYCTLAPRLLFKRGVFTLAVGGTTVHHDYGLVGQFADDTVRHLFFDYGGDAAPHPVPANSPQLGPRLQVQMTTNLDDHRAHRAFTEAMIADGIVRPRRYAPEEADFLRPWYCTWGDQMWLAGEPFRQDVKEAVGYPRIKAVLTQQFVLRAARRIRREGLNIGTIIIDDGWQDKRGDWNLVTERFPDMRGLVDELHAMGFKVLLWWAPFDCEADSRAIADPALVSGPSLAETTIWDYSKPAARLERWLGNGPDGWDLDGFKLDFYMQKVSAAAQQGDPAWRGEERLMVELYRSIQRVGRRYKPYVATITGPWNPHLLDSLVTVFTEEQFGADLEALYAKQAIAEAMLPGLRLTPHFVYNPEDLEGYLRVTRFLGGIPQIGILETPKMTPEHIANLRTWLDGKG